MNSLDVLQMTDQRRYNCFGLVFLNEVASVSDLNQALAGNTLRQLASPYQLESNHHRAPIARSLERASARKVAQSHPYKPDPSVQSGGRTPVDLAQSSMVSHKCPTCQV